MKLSYLVLLVVGFRAEELVDLSQQYEQCVQEGMALMNEYEQLLAKLEQEELHKLKEVGKYKRQTQEQARQLNSCMKELMSLRFDYESLKTKGDGPVL